MLSWVIAGQAQQRASKWLFIETDPVSMSIGARTLWVGVEPPEFRHFSVAFNISSADFSNQIDDLLNPHNQGKGFDARVKLGGGMAIDYFFKANKTRFYIGMIHLFFNNEVSLKNKMATFLTHNIFGRTGYRWYPFKKASFYLNPFIGFRYEYLPQGKEMIVDREFKAAGLQPFGSVHIGYHF